MGSIIALAFLPAAGVWLAAMLYAFRAMRHVRRRQFSTMLWLSFVWPFGGLSDATFEPKGQACWRMARRCLIVFVAYVVCLAVALVVLAGPP